jgi:hypothetical protein
VNPSLTITALAEHAMTRVPPAPGGPDREPRIDADVAEAKDRPPGEPARHAAGEPAEPS